MKIGIFLSARKPTDGGGYTITKDLFDAIIKFYPKKNFYFVIRGDENSYFENNIIKYGFEYTVIKKSKIEIFIKSLLFIIFNYNLFFRDKLDVILRKKKINCLIFLSSENFYPLKTPYISTIWDIQHLSNPNFKIFIFFSNLFICIKFIILLKCNLSLTLPTKTRFILFLPVRLICLIAFNNKIWFLCSQKLAGYIKKLFFFKTFDFNLIFFSSKKILGVGGGTL